MCVCDLKTNSLQVTILKSCKTSCLHTFKCFQVFLSKTSI